MPAGPARRALMLTPDEGRLDRRIAQEAATLAAAGWTVDIHSAVDPGLTYDDVLAPGVRLLVTPAPARRAGAVKRVLRAGKRLVSRVVPAAGRAVEAAQYRRRDIAGEILAANLPALTAGPRYDLVEAHDAPVFPLAAALKAAWGVPLLCDLHEVFAEQDEHFTSPVARAYWRGVEAAGLSVADGILACNEAVLEDAVRTHAPAAPTAVLHNSVPFVPREALATGAASGAGLRGLYPGIPAAARILLFAGSLRPHKHLEVLVEGFGRAALDGWVLAILGEGPLLPALEALVAREGLASRVFVGRRAAQSELIAIAASADAGLLPYQEVGVNYRVATPNKLFEYLAARLPIATSRLPMIERILAGTGTGGFVDFATPATTAAGLRAFVDQVLPGITAERLERAAAGTAWEREEGRLLDLVERVTARPA